jgi:hypothetical protein
MDQQSRGLDAENVRSPLNDGNPETGRSTNGNHPAGIRPVGIRPTGTNSSSSRPQAMIPPRRLPVLDWPAKLYDDAASELDSADCSSDAMLRIVQQRFRLPGAYDQRVIRLAFR